MRERRQDRSDVGLLQAQLRILRTIALAQARWREVAEAIATDVPLPLEGLSPDQESAIRNLQLRRLSPQDRDRVRGEINALEDVLRRRRAGVAEGDRGANGPARDGHAHELPSAVAPDARWFAVAPLSGTVFVPGPAPAETAARGRPQADPHAVRLMNDYSVDWPLWPAFTGVADEMRRLLEDGLAARLRRWAATFNAHYDPFDGWDDPDVAAEHRAEADRLLTALRAALPPPWTVSLDYWETNGSDR